MSPVPKEEFPKAPLYLNTEFILIGDPSNGGVKSVPTVGCLIGRSFHISLESVPRESDARGVQLDI